VTFSDPPPEFTKDQVDAMLQQAHDQSTLLTRIEMELTRSREYILKVFIARCCGVILSASEVSVLTPSFYNRL
jgi:hypothetical protein